jgi:hypothetical protein
MRNAQFSMLNARGIMSIGYAILNVENWKLEDAMFGRELNIKREGLEVVYRAYGMLEAEAIKGRLETSGIPAALD